MLSVRVRSQLVSGKWKETWGRVAHFAPGLRQMKFTLQGYVLLGMKTQIVNGKICGSGHDVHSSEP